MSSKNNSNAKPRSSSGQSAPTGATGSTKGSRSGARKKKPSNGSSLASAGGIQTTTAPAAVGTVFSSGLPKIVSTAHSRRVIHRELVLAAVAGSTTFTVQSTLAINPGLATTFPWLSVQAQGWEQYRVHRLDVQYINTVGTGTAGEVLISPNYDASDPVPVTEAAAANTFTAKSGPVWQPLCTRLDVGAMMALGPRRFVRHNACAGDIKTFDVANVNICSNDQTGTTKIGKIWLDYDIEFFIPQNDPQTSVSTTMSLFRRPVASGDEVLISATPTALSFFESAYDPLRIAVPFVPGTNFFTPPAGTYRVTGQLSAYSNTANSQLAIVVGIQKGLLLVQGSRQLGIWQGALAQAPFGTVTTSIITAFNGSEVCALSVELIGAGVLTVPTTGLALTFELA